MPQFANNPFSSNQLLQKGVPAYLIGSFNFLAANTNAYLSNVALTSNVATVTIAVINGPKPLAGSLISIQASTNTSGLFNVNRAVITGVTWNDSTGSGTVTFALTHADVTSAVDTGGVIIETAEVGETVSAPYISIPVVVQAPEGDSQFTLPVAVKAGSGITAMTATLEVAINANASEWTATTTAVTKTGANTYTAGPVVQATLQRGYAYRINISAVTGSDTVVAKVG